MYPLSCVRVCAHTRRETSAHKKTWSAHKCSFQKCFCRCFIHVVPNTYGSRLNVAQKKFFPHTDFEELEGTLVWVAEVLIKEVFVFWECPC